MFDGVLDTTHHPPNATHRTPPTDHRPLFPAQPSTHPPLPVPHPPPMGRWAVVGGRGVVEARRGTGRGAGAVTVAVGGERGGGRCVGGVRGRWAVVGVQRVVGGGECAEGGGRWWVCKGWWAVVGVQRVVDDVWWGHYLQTGAVLEERSPGKGKTLKAVHTRRVVAAALHVAEAEVPSVIDGADGLVIDLVLPHRGFTRAGFADLGPRAAVAGAYAAAGRGDGARTLQVRLEAVARGFEACDAECAQIVQRSPPAVQQHLSGIARGDGKVVVRKDAANRGRILFNLCDELIRPDYVSVVSGPTHRTPQVIGAASVDFIFSRRPRPHVAAAGLPEKGTPPRLRLTHDVSSAGI